MKEKTKQNTTKNEGSDQTGKRTSHDDVTLSRRRVSEPALEAGSGKPHLAHETKNHHE